MGFTIGTTPALRASNVFVYKPGDIDKETIKNILTRVSGTALRFRPHRCKFEQAESLKRKVSRNDHISQLNLYRKKAKVGPAVADGRLKNMLDKSCWKLSVV